MEPKLISLLVASLGAALVVYAVAGIVRKQITTHGRGGRGSTYTGLAAVKEGLFQLLVGVMFAVGGLVFYWLSGHA